MKSQKAIFLAISFIICISLTNYAQIPNGGFENWSLGDPDLWYTNNVISLKPITQSTDAQVGNYSARLEILDNGGVPFGPLLSAGDNGEGFPVSQRYTALDGYFKYAPQPNTIFHFALVMYRADSLIGVLSSDITTSASNWMPFSIPIVYFMPGNPDSCFLQIGLTSTTDTGAVAYLDELTLSGTNSIDQLSIGQVPVAFELIQNYPNPFNPTTNIEFSIPRASDVKLVIYNQLGQTVATLANERLSAGSYSVDWNAEGLPSGVYFYKMIAGDFTQTRKLILMR